MDNFQACLAFTLQQEGGFVDDPYDPGGATNMGITLGTYQEWFPQATVADLRAIDAATVSEIYENDYWYASGAVEFAPGVNLMMFDMAVNAGPTRAVKLLQQCLGVAQDGRIGPITRAAVAMKSPLDLIKSLGSAQYWFYHGLSTWPNFGRGWTKRVKAREDAATVLAQNSSIL